MALTGMDIGAVRQLATQLSTKADEIDSIMNQLTNALNTVQWVGPDRERFISDWQGHHVASLRQVSQGLRDASTRATQNANDQETVSNNG
jgi:hypothetical protein